MFNTMINEHQTDYQYDRCSSRGICSINPATASLQEVIITYLRHAAYYGLKLEEKGIHDKKIRNLILNTMSVLSSNYEISETNFDLINQTFKTEFPRITEKFKKIYPEEKTLDTDSLFRSKTGLNDYIRYGEKELNKRLNNTSVEERNLYKILFVLIKSLCVNILAYESYEQELNEEILSIYRVFNLQNSSKNSKEKIKEIVIDIAQKDCCLMEKIRSIQEKIYGEQDEYDVSFSTTKGKALLVVGSNLRELESILNMFKDTDTDIYTHDNMILAHTFPKFREYKNLRGQYGQGMENCLLDFSTFPGPIILTRHSLFNVESLYRGRLYTTDFAYSKGVIPIKDNDFSDVIKSINESKGFKTGRDCASEKIGFSIKKVLEKINEKLSSGKYNQFILIGIGGYSAGEKEYFETLTKHIPEDVLIISMFCCKPKENVICINAAGDIYGMNNLLEKILTEIPIKTTLFYPYSDRHTLSVIIKSAGHKNNGIFIGKWNQIVMNPNITDGLKAEFGIETVSLPKKDMDKIFNVK